MIPFMQCLICQNFIEDEPIPICAAFPNGIPTDLWMGKISHEIQYVHETLLFEPIEQILLISNT